MKYYLERAGFMELYPFLYNIHIWSYAVKKQEAISRLFFKNLISASYAETIY